MEIATTLGRSMSYKIQMSSMYLCEWFWWCAFCVDCFMQFLRFISSCTSCTPLIEANKFSHSFTSSYCLSSITIRFDCISCDIVFHHLTKSLYEMYRLCWCLRILFDVNDCSVLPCTSRMKTVKFQWRFLFFIGKPINCIHFRGNSNSMSGSIYLSVVLSHSHRSHTVFCYELWVLCAVLTKATRTTTWIQFSLQYKHNDALQPNTWWWYSTYSERKLILIRAFACVYAYRLIYMPFVSMWNIQFGAFFLLPNW